MYFIYTLILTLGLIVTLPYYVLRFRKYLPTLSDRLGFLKIPQLQKAIWVHAVSVGEVRAVEKLLEGLRQQFPAKPLVVSTATPAGQELARQRRDIIDHTFYFPIDLPWCVRRALRRVNPEMVIIAETEIWPNFLRACHIRGARVVMINGRISDKSFARYRIARRWLRRVFQDYTVIGMQSEMDRERIEAIGADPRRVTVFGNLKYDVASTSRADDGLSTFLNDWQPLWIAASTMPGEEEIVLDAYKDLLKTQPRLALMIVPRHPNRFDGVADLIKGSGFDLLRRTQISTGGHRPPLQIDRSKTPPVLLLDTIGELASVFQCATIVFMGGSMAPTGGHNVLEPARHGKPVVFGPHMENFRDIARQFVEARAGLQIQKPSELAPAISKLLSNVDAAAEMGRKARAVVEQNMGATERVLQFLEPLEAQR